MKNKVRELKVKETTRKVLDQLTCMCKALGYEAEHIHTKIVEMMAIDYQPLSVVSDAGFIHLLHTIEHMYKIPNRKYFTGNMLPTI